MKKKINIGRVIAGGLIAAFVQYLIEGVVNTGLGADWMAWGEKAKTAFGPLPTPAASMTYWFIQSLVLGIAGMWVYAGIRPRYGAGPGTAARAGLSIWATSWLSCSLNYLALGIIPGVLNWGNCAAGLVAAPLSIVAGAWIYKE